MEVLVSECAVGSFAWSWCFGADSWHDRCSWRLFVAVESSGPDAVEGVSSGTVLGRSVLWCGRREVSLDCVDLMDMRLSLARTD